MAETKVTKDDLVRVVKAGPEDEQRFIAAHARRLEAQATIVQTIAIVMVLLAVGLFIPAVVMVGKLAQAAMQWQP